MKTNSEEKNILETPPQKRKRDAVQKQIRGSGLLLSGKFISVGINFVSQVLVVRYLTQADYGAWAYGLAIVAFFHGFSSLGLQRAITRFIPIYQEQEEYDKLFGAILLTLGTILCISLLVIGAIYTFPETISHLINGENQPVALVLILIFMVPVGAIDDMIIGLFACFRNSRAIFFRKFLAAPGIKLAAVLLLILAESSVTLLACGYLAGNALTVGIYSWMILKLFRKKGLLGKFNFRNTTVPAKELFAFTIPLLSSDLASVLMHSSDTLMLGFFRDTAQVALYQVILPACHLNKLVMVSFALLYTPAAARLFAKKDYAGINNIYWQTAIWVGVLSFPLFAMTFSMAKSLTLALYGPRYEASYVFLQLLSFGYYFNVVTGFNGLTLKVLGKLRYVVIINVVAMVLNLILNLVMIPLWGALGASIATTVSMVVHNILKQAGLKLASGIKIFDWRYFSYYVVITLAALAIFLCQVLVSENVYVLTTLVGVVSLLVLKLCGKKLNLEETFPEIAKLPLVKYVFKKRA